MSRGLRGGGRRGGGRGVMRVRRGRWAGARRGGAPRGGRRGAVCAGGGGRGGRGGGRGGRASRDVLFVLCRMLKLGRNIIWTKATPAKKIA